MGRPEVISKVVLDASALLGVVMGERAFLPLKPMPEAIDRGDIQLVQSTAMLVELRPRHPRDNSTHAKIRSDLVALLRSPRTQLVDVNTLVARKAAELAVNHGLKTWDAIHLATAVLANADVLVVRDSKFPEGECEGVWITPPFDLNEGMLPFE